MNPNLRTSFFDLLTAIAEMSRISTPMAQGLTESTAAVIKTVHIVGKEASIAIYGTSNCPALICCAGFSVKTNFILSPGGTSGYGAMICPPHSLLSTLLTNMYHFPAYCFKEFTDARILHAEDYTFDMHPVVIMLMNGL